MKKVRYWVRTYDPITQEQNSKEITRFRAWYLRIKNFIRRVAN
jgi:hypothetical protein